MVLKSLIDQFKNIPSSAFNYAPGPGREDFRKIWFEFLFKKNPSLKGKNISLPVVTSALTHGLTIAGYLFTEKNDSIILPDLYWENYDLVFNLTFGASFVTYPMFKDKGYNIKGLEEAIYKVKSDKKIILLNFPNNPTGYTVTKNEATGICSVIKEAAEKGNRIVVFVDDAYFGLFYEEDILKESIFSMLCNLHERVLAVKIDGPTKEDYVWGFRLGFITLGCLKNSPLMYSALESKIAGAIRATISNSSNPGQILLLKAWQSESYDEEKKEKADILKERYNRVKEIFNSHPEYKEFFEPLPFNSGYFMCIKLKKDSEEIRKILLERYNTGTIVFNSIMRLAYSSVPLSKIDKLFESIFLASKECRK